MPEASGPNEIVHLGWRANGDGFDTALAVNRLLAVGARSWWLQSQHDGADGGDYVVELAPGQRAGLARLGVSVVPWCGAIPENALPLSSPAVRLFAGTASKFPYFAYYALCLLRLGIDYKPCDGRALAQGTLDDANLLILREFHSLLQFGRQVRQRFLVRAAVVVDLGREGLHVGVHRGVDVLLGCF